MKSVQIISGTTFANGVVISDAPIRGARGLEWAVQFECGHQGKARHSDLEFGLPILCAQCQKSILEKSVGIESSASFADWNERVRMRKPEGGRQMLRMILGEKKVEGEHGAI